MFSDKIGVISEKEYKEILEAKEKNPLILSSIDPRKTVSFDEKLVNQDVLSNNLNDDIVYVEEVKNGVFSKKSVIHIVNEGDQKEKIYQLEELAKDLIAEVYAYLNTAKGTYANKLQAVVNAFNASPYLVEGQAPVIYDDNGNQVKYDLTFGDATINVAKYKSAGLYVKYEDLGTFVNGTMVENFNAAVKAIYDKDMNDGLTDRITVLETPIETEFGYHLYINLSSAKITTYDSYKVNVKEDGSWEYVYEDEEKTVHAVEERVYPQLYEILIYTKDSLSEELTAGANTAIASYYKDVNTEISGSYFTYICQYKDLMNVLSDNGISELASYNKADLERMVKLNIESWFENNLEKLESGDEDIIRGIK